MEEIRFEDETIQNTEETIKLLKDENESLKDRLYKSNESTPAKIGLSLSAVGAALLALSVLSGSLVLAFIGLGLTFWGLLFFLIRPTRFVRSDMLSSTTIAYYVSIDRILADLKYKGKALYIPPFPAKVELPSHLKGLKDTILFFPSTPNSKGTPSMDELAERKFMIMNPKGMVLAPPGLGLAAFFDKGLQLNPIQSDLESLFVALSRMIVEDFQLAREVKFKLEDDKIQLTIIDSAYRELFYQEPAARSVLIVGCPIVSAVAIKLARMTGRIVVVNKYALLEKGRIIQVLFEFEEEE